MIRREPGERGRSIRRGCLALCENDVRALLAGVAGVPGEYRLLYRVLLSTGSRGYEAAQLQWAMSNMRGIQKRRPGVIWRQAFKTAGEGGRTLDIHVGNVTLYH